MNKILNRNLNKVTKDTVYIVHKDWKDGSEKVVAEVYLDKNLSLSQKIDQAFQPVSDFFSEVVFFTIGGTPFVLILLVGSALFFTIYFDGRCSTV